jgi:hypothetical protein
MAPDRLVRLSNALENRVAVTRNAGRTDEGDSRGPGRRRHLQAVRTWSSAVGPRRKDLEADVLAGLLGSPTEGVVAAEKAYVITIPPGSNVASAIVVVSALGDQRPFAPGSPGPSRMQQRPDGRRSAVHATGVRRHGCCPRVRSGGSTRNRVSE